MNFVSTFPRTVVEFQRKFVDETACRAYWMSIIWPEGFVCPKCKSREAWQLRGRDELECAKCGKQTSPRVGTVLHKSSKSYRDWLWAMLWMTTNKQSISALRLKTHMGFGSYDTALRWLRELRRVMAEEPGKELLGPVVEVDEVLLGGKEKTGAKGHRKKMIVVAAIEQVFNGSGRLRLRYIKTDNKHDLGGFIHDFVEAGANVKTDKARGYRPLDKEKYRHDLREVTEKKLEDGTAAVAIHLPEIHRIFSLIRRVMLGAYQGAVREKHLQGYLDEYAFRFNRRNTKTPLGITQELVARAARSQCVPLWKSRGRFDPKIPTRKANTRWQEFAVSLIECLDPNFGEAA